MKRPVCPVCQKPAVETTATIRFRRGSRVLPVETRQWRCPAECVGPKGEVPFVFADLATMKENEARAKAEWQARFGEAMPRAGRGGRPTEDPHDERLQVRLTAAEIEALDVARGEVSRSEFVRMRVLGTVPAIRTLDTSEALARGSEPTARRHRDERKRLARDKAARPRHNRLPLPIASVKGWLHG